MAEQDNVVRVRQAYAASGRGDVPAVLAWLDRNIMDALAALKSLPARRK